MELVEVYDGIPWLTLKHYQHLKARVSANP